MSTVIESNLENTESTADDSSSAQPQGDDDESYYSYSYCSDNDDDESGLGFLDGFLTEELNLGGAEEPPTLFNIDPVTCPICFTVAEAGMALTLPDCHHSFCMDCFKQYVTAQLGCGNANCIRCPLPVDECGKQIGSSESFLQDVLDQETHQKLLHCQDSAFVLSNPDYHHCPSPDCSNIVYWKPPGPPIVDCFQCQRTSCLKCSASPYHTGRSCEEYKKQQEEDRRRLNRLMGGFARQSTVDRSRAGEATNYEYQPTDASLAALNIKICRRCGTGVEHGSGCLKMKCRCGYRFCFQCGSENAQCDCTPAHHGFTDNVTGGGDFSGLRDSKSYT